MRVDHVGDPIVVTVTETVSGGSFSVTRAASASMGCIDPSDLLDVIRALSEAARVNRTEDEG